MFTARLPPSVAMDTKLGTFVRALFVLHQISPPLTRRGCEGRAPDLIPSEMEYTYRVNSVKF